MQASLFHHNHRLPPQPNPDPLQVPTTVTLPCAKDFPAPLPAVDAVTAWAPQQEPAAAPRDYTGITQPQLVVGTSEKAGILTTSHSYQHPQGGGDRWASVGQLHRYLYLCAMSHIVWPILLCISTLLGAGC